MTALAARAAGAARIWVTGLTIDKQRLELAKKLGFNNVNIEEQPVVEIVMEATERLGVDAVFDATSAGAGNENLKLLKPGGQLVIIAIASAGLLTFDGSELGRLSEGKIFFTRGRNPHTFYRTINLVASGAIDIRPLITHMPLTEADKGFQILKRREAMKIILVP